MVGKDTGIVMDTYLKQAVWHLDNVQGDTYEEELVRATTAIAYALVSLVMNLPTDTDRSLEQIATAALAIAQEHMPPAMKNPGSKD